MKVCRFYTVYVGNRTFVKCRTSLIDREFREGMSLLHTFMWGTGRLSSAGRPL